MTVLNNDLIASNNAQFRAYELSNELFNEYRLVALKKWCEAHNHMVEYNQLLSELNNLTDCKALHKDNLLNDLIENFFADVCRLTLLMVELPNLLHGTPEDNLVKLVDTAKKVSRLVQVAKVGGDVSAAVVELNKSADSLKYSVAGSLSPLAGVMIGASLFALGLAMVVLPYVAVPLLGGLVGILATYGTCALIAAELGLIAGIGVAPITAMYGAFLAYTSGEKAAASYAAVKTQSSAKKFAENSSILFAKKSERVVEQVEVFDYRIAAQQV